MCPACLAFNQFAWFACIAGSQGDTFGVMGHLSIRGGRALPASLKRVWRARFSRPAELA